MLRLMRTLNKNCDSPLEDSVLEDSFERWWPDLENAVQLAIAGNPDSAPTTKRSESDKVDEILLMVRNINVRLASAPEPDTKLSLTKTDAMLRDRDIKRLLGRRRELLEALAEFDATYPGRFVLKNGEAIGEVMSARKIGETLRVQIDPITTHGSESRPEPWVADASDLEFSDVPF